MNHFHFNVKNTVILGIPKITLFIITIGISCVGKNGNAITESFVDYNKDNGEIETIDEGDDDEVDEVRMSNQSLNYDDEQRRVSELPNDQLKKYPYSILVVGCYFTEIFWLQLETRIAL